MNSLCRPPGGSHRARPFMLLRMGIGLAALALGRGAAPAETFHWTGTGGTNWFDAANWTGESGQPGVPGDGDSATIGAGAVLLTNSTASLAALVVDGGTLTCSNWPTRINAVTVTLNGGRLTLPPAFRETGTSNRVWIVCSNLTVASGGTIDVSGKGFAGGDWNTSGHGPGKGAGSATTSRAGGGGYGGCASRSSRAGIGSPANSRARTSRMPDRRTTASRCSGPPSAICRAPMAPFTSGAPPEPFY